MKKAVVFTLGCKVNDCESGSLMQGLSELGYEVTDELVPADLYILNTCAVTGEAEKKSRQCVARVQKLNPAARVVVCGCASQRDPHAFAEKPNVTLVSGARQKGRILSLLQEKGVNIDDGDKAYDELLPAKNLKTRAFVKIQDGCDNFCSYCIIPYLRGRSRSRSLASAAAEILGSAALETVVTGIDVSSYRDGEHDLADLMIAVANAKSRLRLGSLEVGVITGRLLDALKKVRDFAPHFHLSLQSGADAVLKKMNRHYTSAQYLEKVELIRRYFPRAAITTDIIAGFPTETEEDFAETLDFIGRVGFSQIHCFCYSRREGTNAAKWKELPAAVKNERLHILLQRAKEVREEYERGFVGETLSMICEEEKHGFTEGYGENYIRLYLAGKYTGKFGVVAVRPYADGLLVEPVNETKGESK